MLLAYLYFLFSIHSIKVHPCQIVKLNPIFLPLPFYYPSHSQYGSTHTPPMRKRYYSSSPCFIVMLFLGQERLLGMKLIYFTRTIMISKLLYLTSTWTKTMSCIKPSSTPSNKPNLVPLI